MIYFLKRAAALIVTLFFISLITFVAFDLIPGDSAITTLGPNATEEQIEQFREERGLNDPLPVRYGKWLSRALRGDFGDSYQYGIPVTELISERALTTLILALMAFIFIYVPAIPLGMLSAKFTGKWQDRTMHVVSQIIMAVPPFFMGIILTAIFGIVLNVFSVGDFVFPHEDFWKCIGYLVLPAVAIALPKIAMVMKYLRNSVLEEVNKDYMKTAVASGSTKRTAMWRHAFRNAIIPVITFSTMMIGEILSGSIIVEQVFSVQGIGRLMITGISMRDYPVITALVLYIAFIVIVINMLGDIAYRLADPRLRRQKL
ncbi:MAG: ABC transporter permease [Lachnospiraceae bacterium]|nr:ABC transporter permease [Lachnospiraceae bacterium]